MLTYALMLGLCGRAGDAVAWMQRAAARIAADPEPSAKDVATLDALRLLSFTITAEPDEQIEAGRRAVDAVEQGFDLGIIGSRARMNLVRCYLLLDQLDDAQWALHEGTPGDEIATVLVAPALAARLALRHGRTVEAERQAGIALRAAKAFGLDAHLGAIDAHLAQVGVLIDRNELAEASPSIEQTAEIVAGHQEARSFHVLLQLEIVRVAAARDDFDVVFATLDEVSKYVGQSPRSAFGRMVDAVAARWHLQVGETAHAEDLIAALHVGSPAHTLLSARLDLAHHRLDAVVERLARPGIATIRDRLTSELILARAAITSGGTAADLTLAVELAAQERLVRPILEEGDTVTRLARLAAESLQSEGGDKLAMALGMPARSRAGRRQSTPLLTERELIVLRYLPTRLTYSQIGHECFTSLNTVKSHVKCIYRKLGVSSRAEAVARAQVLGLL